MPKSSFTECELEQLFNSILAEAGQSDAEQLLSRCHEYFAASDPNGESLGPHERYFRKEIEYEDFDIHIRRFLCDSGTVLEADIQFKRPSRFPAPLWNRNRRLFTKLRKLLRRAYAELGIEVKGSDGGRQVHFCVSSNSFWWNVSTTFEEWESECAIYDEPHSSGQTDPHETTIRNDFVLFRFRRKAAYMKQFPILCHARSLPEAAEIPHR